MSLENQKKRIYDRYFRQVIKNPDGAIVHFGDCDFYSTKVCTCGLFRDLLPLGEDQEEIYPNFWEEYGVHEEILRECQEMLREYPEKFKYKDSEMSEEELRKILTKAGWKTSKEMEEEKKRKLTYKNKQV